MTTTKAMRKMLTELKGKYKYTNVYRTGNHTVQALLKRGLIREINRNIGAEWIKVELTLEGFVEAEKDEHDANG